MIHVCIIWIVSLAFHHTYSLSNAPRKRLGKSSFIQKREKGAHKTKITNDELISLISKYQNRVPGSAQYRKAWSNWCQIAIEAIRSELSSNLPYAADKAALESLFYQLGVAADEGVMPSFSHPGARAAYALEFFSRARGLGDLLIDSHGANYYLPSFWKQQIQYSQILGGMKEDENRVYNITSIGGGPGFDFVGFALATAFNSTESRAKIQAIILDYEEGWSELVESMFISTSKILGTSKLSCKWGGKCDITKEMKHSDNYSCQSLVTTTDVFVCQFCIAENAKLLQSSNFVFFRDLFQSAKTNSIFLFTEVTPRNWPDIFWLIKTENLNMQLSFVKKGRILMIYKRGAARVDPNENGTSQADLISEADMLLMQEFESIAHSHNNKTSRQRQHPNFSSKQ